MPSLPSFPKEKWISSFIRANIVSSFAFWSRWRKLHIQTKRPVEKEGRRNKFFRRRKQKVSLFLSLISSSSSARDAKRVHSTIGERDPMKARFTRLFDPPASPIFSRNLVVCKRFLRQTRKVFHSAWSYFRLPAETITIVPSKFEGNNMARRVNVRLNFNKHRILSRSPL